MPDIPSVSAIIAAIGVLVGVALTVLELRNLVKQRQTDLIMRLYSQTCTKEFMDATLKTMSLKVKDYSEFVEKYGTLASEGPRQTAFQITCMFLEGIGVLLHRKLVDVEVINELFPVVTLWKKAEPIVLGYRKQTGASQAYGWFEYLYKEVNKADQRGVSRG